MAESEEQKIIDRIEKEFKDSFSYLGKLQLDCLSLFLIRGRYTAALYIILNAEELSLFGMPISSIAPLSPVLFPEYNHPTEDEQ